MIADVTDVTDADNQNNIILQKQMKILANLIMTYQWGKLCK